MESKAENLFVFFDPSSILPLYMGEVNGFSLNFSPVIGETQRGYKQ